VADKCVQRSRFGKRFTIIAVGEGAKPVGGQQFVDHVDKTSPDPIRLGGVGRFVAQQVETMTGIEGRYVVLGHVQRGGIPTARDRILATQFGFHAFELLMGGRFGEVVVEKAGRITSAPIVEVADKVRTVPPDHPLIAAARGIGTCFGND